MPHISTFIYPERILNLGEGKIRDKVAKNALTLVSIVTWCDKLFKQDGAGRRDSKQTLSNKVIHSFKLLGMAEKLSSQL